MSSERVKLNGTTKSDLIIALGNFLNKNNVKGINAIKKGLTEALDAKKTTKKGKEVAIYKNVNETLVKAVLRSLKASGVEVTEALSTGVHDKIMAFGDILASAPSRPYSAFMKFSISFCASNDLKDVPLMERAPKVKEAWTKLDEKKRATYNPSDAEKKTYEDARAALDKSIKDFKACGDVVVPEKPKRTRKTPEQALEQGAKSKRAKKTTEVVPVQEVAAPVQVAPMQEAVVPVQAPVEVKAKKGKKEVAPVQAAVAPVQAAVAPVQTPAPVEVKTKKGKKEVVPVQAAVAPVVTPAPVVPVQAVPVEVKAKKTAKKAIKV